jgi:hypothetical protein
VLSAIADVQRRFREFAERECRGYSDLYERLALAVAADDDVAGFVAAMPVVQPNLFFAAVHFLTGSDDMPTGGALPEFVRTRSDQIASLMRTRRTQTNEVGRCAVLLPALPAGPLALLEVGASAGLCLLLDRFAYEFGRRLIGDASSTVRLRCEARGPVPLPSTLPRVVWRRGLDVHPIDVRDDDAVRWLLACVWADHPHRRRRLNAAIAVARAEPPMVTRGDLVEDLPAVAAEAPEDATLVVFHSAVLSYVSPERRRVFAAVLADVSKRREVVWVSNEGPGVVADIAALAPPLGELRFLLGRTQFSAGRRRDELLALSHPHGGQLTWR